MINSETFSAAAQDGPVLGMESSLAQGMTKFISILPSLQEAFARLTIPQEKAQFIRGLEQLRRSIADLLKIKKLVIQALTKGDTRLETIKDELRSFRSQMNFVKAALDFINPVYYDHVYGAGSDENEKRISLRDNFYLAEDLIKSGLDGKDTAFALMNNWMFSPVDNVSEVIAVFRASEVALTKAQIAVRKFLESTRKK